MSDIALMTKIAFDGLKVHLYAIAQIQALPRERQEYSDMLTMCDTVRTADDSLLVISLYDVERHLGREIDLWLNDCDDLERRNSIRKQVTEKQESRKKNYIEFSAPTSN